MPTIAELAVSLLNNSVSRTSPSVRMTRGSRERDGRLSFAQERLWFLDQFQPGRATYNLPGALRITAPLNVNALESSVNEIVRRHEVLRTTFALVEERPVQVIASEAKVSLPVVDLSGREASARQVEALRLAAEEAQPPFDLARGPLLRTTLLRLGEADHVLLLTMHHIVSDAWSMGVLFRELITLYEGYASGRPSALAELPIQYGDIAHSQS